MSGKKRVAVVIPRHRFPLTDNERVSWRMLNTYLNDFDTYVVCPQKYEQYVLDSRCGCIPICEFDLSSELKYNQSLVTPEFDQRFNDYEYILIYQLDCLVFSSDLLYWCDKGWDYVGAPWWVNYCQATDAGLMGVGNGGLSLRKVDTAIKVLKLPGFKEHIDNLRTADNFKGHEHEDMFWSWEAKKLYPEFFIPTPQEALEFSFEVSPQACFAANNNRLPFGCHNWAAYDKDWWTLVMETDSQ